jgi:hypothetical protein
MRLCGPNHAASGHEFVQSDKATDRKGTAALQEFVLLLTSKQGFFFGYMCVCLFVCKACKKTEIWTNIVNSTDELPIGDGSFSCSRSRRNKKKAETCRRLLTHIHF